MAVYYLCNWDGPSGGIKVLYDHVRLLRRSGVDAFLAATGRFQRCIWFRHQDAETPSREHILAHLGPSDVLVLPDLACAAPELLRAPARKVAFVQNHTLLPREADPARFDAFLVPSWPLQKVLRQRFGTGVPVRVVQGFLERELVRPPRRWTGGPLRVLCIPRRDKHRGEPYDAIRALRARRIAVTEVTHAMLREDFVRLFQSHALYLHLSYPEGFPGPVIEAFGAGCLVIGFAGLGGLELMKDGRNAFVVPDGDWRAAVAKAQAVARLPAGALDALLEDARATALHYHEDRMRRRLAEVFRDLAAPALLR